MERKPETTFHLREHTVGAIDFSAYGAGDRYRRTEPDLLMASANKIYLCDAGESHDGTPFTATLTRESIPINPGQIGQGQLTDLWPEIEASGAIQIKLGYQKKLGDTITWGQAHAFDATSAAHFAEACTDMTDLVMTGRFISIQFQSTTDVSWALLSFTLEFNPQGNY